MLPAGRSKTIHVEIPDEAGSLASVATLLALNGISIKNIGITHNRESEDGVLRIEFYGEDAIQKAAKLLTARGYTIFVKK
jgi:prephenate dehydrogenase